MDLQNYPHVNIFQRAYEHGTGLDITQLNNAP